MNKIKKLLAGLLSLSMVFVMASCGETEESSTAGKTEETTSSAETEATTEEAEETEAEEEKEEVVEEEEETTEIDKSKLVYDFAGLDSEEIVKIFTSGKYMLTLSMTDFGMEQTIYFDNEKCRQSISSMGMGYDVLITDGKSYMLLEDAHCEVPLEEAGIDSSTETMDMFAELGYYESGETEYNGSTCRFDKYYESVSDTLISFIMDDSNELVAMEAEGMVMGVSEYSGDFDASLLEISPDSRAVDQEEFGNLMMAAMGMGDMVAGEGEEGAETEEAEATTEAESEESVAE
ncbi:MAG: hypothetical protein E7510_00875 [Ruminococcus sp.]|nr:hypothetical protein [Ruminococcus sp.]